MVVAGRRLFRLQSFHYELAQAVRIALAFFGKLDNQLPFSAKRLWATLVLSDWPTTLFVHWIRPQKAMNL